MIISFQEAKAVDRVTYELPIDFLCFVRYFSYDILAQQVARQEQNELVSYTTLYFIFEKMGLIPFNMDVGIWTIEMNQGMNAFQTFDESGPGLHTGMKMVDGRHAFMKVQIRDAN